MKESINREYECYALKCYFDTDDELKERCQVISYLINYPPPLASRQGGRYSAEQFRTFVRMYCIYCI